MFVPTLLSAFPERRRRPGLLDWFEKRRLRDRIEADPCFQAKASGKGLLCPFCLVATPRGRTGEESREVLVDHILYSCHGYFGPNTPTESLEHIQAVQQMHLLREQVRRQPVWNVTDENGFWVCPYCAKSTSIYFSKNLKGEMLLIRDMHSHLSQCPDYLRPGSSPRDEDSLRHQILLASKESLLMEHIRERISSNSPFFCQTTKQGDWVCPFCLKREMEIKLDTYIMKRHTAPALIARHLIYDCESFRKSTTTRTLRDISRRLAELNGDGLSAKMPVVGAMPVPETEPLCCEGNGQDHAKEINEPKALCSAHKYRSAFAPQETVMKTLTLVEVLVVLAIVSLLASLMISGLNRSLETARLAWCSSQMKDLGTTTQLYVTDHDGVFPEFYYTKNVHHTKGGFVLLVEPQMAAMPGWSEYDPSQITCPSDKTPYPHSVRMDDGSIQELPVSYGMNISIDVNEINWRYLPSPCSSPFFYDGVMRKDNKALDDSGSDSDGGKFQGRFWTTESFTFDTLRRRHPLNGGYGNILFTDWHVAGYSSLDELPVFDVLPPVETP